MVQVNIHDFKEMVLRLVEVCYDFADGCIDASLVVEALHGTNDAYILALTVLAKKHVSTVHVLSPPAHEQLEAA